VGNTVKYRQLKALARRADRARGEERNRLVEELVRELPKLDPFEGFSEDTIWLAKLVARLKWVDFDEFS
jgi:hypothetical protein